MMIAKMVIDASHIFAWEFYNQIDVKNKSRRREHVANLKKDIVVYGDFEKKNLANVFIAGFNPQELLTGNKKEGEGRLAEQADEKQGTRAIGEKVSAMFGGRWWLYCVA